MSNDKTHVEGIFQVGNGSSKTTSGNGRSFAPEQWDVSPKHVVISRDETTNLLKNSASRPSATESSPLEVLTSNLKEFFDCKSEIASIKFGALHRAASNGETHIPRKDDLEGKLCEAISKRNYTKASRLATALTLVLAAPGDKKAMDDALRFVSVTPGGVPESEYVNTTPSINLSARVARAKQRVFNGKETTYDVLGVGLVDLEMLKCPAIYNPSDRIGYSSFAHFFVIAIARDGWQLYQAWDSNGDNAYSMKKWLANNGARVRNWKEMRPWLKTFAILATPDKVWTQKINDAYAKLFEVNILDLSRKKVLKKPITPTYRPYVRLHEIVDVKMSDVGKFTWE